MTRALSCLCVLFIPLCTVVRAEVKRDIEYARPGNAPLLLDAYLPDTPTTARSPDGAVAPAAVKPFHPIVIVIHGGGWGSGSKTGDTAPLLEPLRAAGFVTLAIDYRLAPAHRWPACFEDLRSAIRYAKSHARDFSADASRIALLGYSAGGQLACLHATRNDDPDTAVQAVVALAPPTDFEQDLPQRGGLSKALQDLLNRPKEVTDESRALIRDLSPINHVEPNLPPFLVVQGSADKTVPAIQSQNFVAKLKAANVPADLLVLYNAPHRLSTWTDFEPAYAAKITDWLRATLAK